MRFVGLVDCNNFFVSCERVFKPWLADKPVVVTSHGEGCAVAMSEEAKGIGVTRGMPIFQARELIRRHGIAIVAGNHRTYGNLSVRVMATIESIVPDIEVYSIDEAFLNFSDSDSATVERMARHVVATVRRHVGLPTSIGVAPTKTLAKIAARMAKKNPAFRSVCVLSDQDSINQALAQTPVGHVWGIGRKLAARLEKVGIVHASNLADLPKTQAERLLNVVGQRTWRELNGEPCIDRDPEATAKKQICSTRTFSPSVSALPRLEEAITSFMATASRKLRRQKSAAKGVSVFLQTNSYRKDLPQYCNSAYRQLEEPTGDQLTLVKHSLDALREIYRDGLSYRRAGVIITDTVSAEGIQPSLFSSSEDRRKRQALNTTVDTLNTDPFISDKLRVATSAPAGTTPEHLSDELLRHKHDTHED